MFYYQLNNLIYNFLNSETKFLKSLVTFSRLIISINELLRFLEKMAASKPTLKLF